MKKNLLLLLSIALLPSISFASLYNCRGLGFQIDLLSNPIEMRISGNGFNSIAKSVTINTNFDTVVTTNTSSPQASIKLTIKDSSFGSPGDNFTSSMQVSSAQGIKEYQPMTCTKGND